MRAFDQRLDDAYLLSENMPVRNNVHGPQIYWVLHNTSKLRPKAIQLDVDMFCMGMHGLANQAMKLFRDKKKQRLYPMQSASLEFYLSCGSYRTRPSVL